MKRVGDLQIEGAAELLRNLERLNGNLKGAAARALQAAAKPIVSAARSRVPVVSGRTKRSLGTVVRRKRTAWPYAAIGARTGFKVNVGRKRDGKDRYSDPAMTAHLVEGGTRPHEVGPSFKLYMPGKGIVTARSVHPGSKAQPFLKPAIDTAGRGAGEIIAATLRKEIEKNKGKALVTL